ncbi:hypothetical protein MVEN_02327000 [Mycena venus]|uniref:DUF6535 domain-containing protein n=1 Tax=Mycena venus TaxID=2733690 RepID=A0A8H6X3E0_9AGAR|nr:hypothetical protein MVEN_02327000 [Mycena venus]
MSSTAYIAPSPRREDRDELAGAKLWSVYISEAARYDKALVEGWKSDMECLFIFAGLFSATFLIESCKTLSPDQGTITIAMLARLAEQLEAGTNTSALDASPLLAVHPGPSSLACNTLWILTLGSVSPALLLPHSWSKGQGNAVTDVVFRLPASNTAVHHGSGTSMPPSRLGVSLAEADPG